MKREAQWDDALRVSLDFFEGHLADHQADLAPDGALDDLS